MMKKFTQTLLLFCLAFAINVQAQPIIFENFENGDPFAANNVTTGYGLATFNCAEASYAIGANLNSICNLFPNVPAVNPNPGNCMTTNEDNGILNPRLLYRQAGLNLNPGPHVVRFRTVQRNVFLNIQVDATLSDAIGNFFFQTVALPMNNNWVGQTVILNPTVATTFFDLTVTNPQWNGDFAIDDIALCAPNIELINIGPDPGCLKEDISICGEVEDCGALGRVELRISRDDQVVLTLEVDVNPDGTFCYTSPNVEALYFLGLESGVYYDVVPALVLNDANQTTVIGDSYEDGLNNDFLLDCCAIEPVGNISFPACTFEGHVFDVEVNFTETITEDDIALIYSTSANFELLSTSVDISQSSGATTITLTFESRGCSCDGDMLSFDIRLVGCESNIWIMSNENIPCCESACSEVDLQSLEITDECEILNGNVVYPFVGALNLTPGTEIISITPQATTGICPTQVADFEYDVINNTVNISGIMQVLNPNCGWGDIVLEIETDVTCCSLVIPVSYPEVCDERSCLDGQPEVQSLCNGNLTISVPNSSGGVVLTNNITGLTISPLIGTVSCVSHVSSNGQVFTYPCDGLVYSFDNNCGELENPEDSQYDLTISIGRCEYRFVGDYCESINCGTSEFSEGSSNRSSDQGIEFTEAFEVNLFPNPITPGGTLNINSTTLIKEVSLLDLQGRLVINQNLDQSSTSIKLTTPHVIQPGVYAVKLVTVEDETKMMRVLVLNQ